MANNRKPEGRPVTCCICGMAGGTLVKVSDGKYRHKDTDRCRILSMRKEVKSDEAKS